MFVYNGVIENFEEFKNVYLIDDYFIGEIDIEIIVYLIEIFVKDMMVKEVFLKVLCVIKGFYVFVLIDCIIFDVIYVVKNKSLLLVGFGDGFNVIVSDVMVMFVYMKKFVEVEDEEMVIVILDKIII